jgi:hypothetical protein
VRTGRGVPDGDRLATGMDIAGVYEAGVPRRIP